MDRTLLVGLIVMASALTPSLSRAGEGAVYNGAPCSECDANGNYYGGFKQFWHRCQVDWHRNNAWPEPFLSADKMAVRAPYCIQVDNGWKMQNTIGTFLFDSESQRINQAGDLLVKWIISQGHANSRY